jgi:anti-sigma regulatory factor (Ser/Thr protein kinase)
VRRASPKIGRLRVFAATDEMVVTRWLPGDVSAPGMARAAIADALRGRIPPVALDDALLVVSELVANAVIHGGVSGEDRIELRVRLGPRSMCVKVFDEGGGFDAAAARRIAEPGTVGGHGLGIVDHLAADWGHARVDGRTEVWAELPR